MTLYSQFKPFWMALLCRVMTTGQDYSDPPKQRKDDPKEAPHFRTHRIHAINSDWYF